MPHLHIEKFKEVIFPSTYEGATFEFIANNIKHKEEKLISVKLDGKRFFLLVNEEEKRSLLKTDKLTRPASTYDSHIALLSYAKLAELEILSSNVVDQKRNIHLEEVTALKSIEFFANNFPKDKEISIEVGFGSGRHLLHQAKNNPNILYVGIEIHRPSIEQVLKQITIQKLDNILVLDYDARLFMELVPSNIVNKIYVHFPVPWDKKPHRRVISTSFIEEARRVLKVDGRLELRTDSENYYSYSYETFIAFPKTTLHINKNKDIEIVSKYEDRWKKMEKNIYDVTMINEYESPKLEIVGSFEFRKTTLSNEEIASFSNVIKRFEGGFINFERIYTISNGMLLRISMGSFDRPEHLYVIIEDSNISYYPALPLASKSNYKAHQFLDEVLYG